MPPDYQAFCTLHQRTYFNYAQIHLTDPATASEAVGKAFGDLAMAWPWILRCTNPTTRAWRILIARIRPTRHQLPRLLCATDYASLSPSAQRAILAITQDQHDVVVLHQALGYSLSELSTTLGYEPGRIRSLHSSALRCLSAAAGHDTQDRNASPTPRQAEETARRVQAPLTV